MNRVAGKVALISGGARGMGLSHGWLLCEEGASVVLGDVRDAEVETAASDLRAAGHQAASIRLDVTSAEDWSTAVAFIEERFGRLDILVNNAGVIDEGGAVDEPEADWARVIGVNQTGVFLGIKHAVPAMRRAGGGSIVNVSSILAIGGAEDYIAYQASKAAVLAITRSAALSYVADGIRANAICPGFILTPMTESLPQEIHEHDIGNTPMLRPGEPREVSQAVLFLASDESSYVTGVALPVDGGYLAQ